MVRNEHRGRSRHVGSPSRRAWLDRWLPVAWVGLVAGGRLAPWLAALFATLFAPRQAHAVRVNDVQRFATLCGPAVGRRPQGVCEVPDGATVELVAEVSGLGMPPLHPRHWFVRVRSGPCAGAEFTVRQGRLLDERDTPEPTEGPRGPVR